MNPSAPEIKPISASSLDFSNTEIAFAHHSNASIKRSYFLFKTMGNPALVNYGTKLLNVAFKLYLPIGWAVKATVFKQFCGGENIVECQKTIDDNARFGVGAILDYSVEGEKTERAFEATAAEIIATIDRAATQPSKIPFSVFKITGVAAFSLLEKVQAKLPLSDKEQLAFDKARERVHSICLRAAEKQVRIFIDGEETWIQEVIDNLCLEMMQRYNRNLPIVYNTYQIYRKAALPNLLTHIELARKEGFFFGAKLVRGAYMEKERRRAAELNYPDPIQLTKADTDADYNSALLACLDNADIVSICAGTHNEESSKLLALEMEKRGFANDDERFYFSQLLGMSDNISFIMAQQGYNVAKYVPYGPVAAVMPYLSRRAQENTSIAGQTSRELLLIEKELKRRGLK